MSSLRRLVPRTRRGSRVNVMCPEPIGRRCHPGVALLLAALVSVVAAACTQDDGPSRPATTATAPVPATITCSTAYRISSREPLTEVDRMRFGAEDTTQSIPYIYLELHGQYTAGQADGERALRLWVTPTGTEQVLVTQLYQLPQDAGPTNQFAGGHGFTGLSYAYDPVSGAELQYWCEAG